MTAHALSPKTNSIDGLCAVIDRAYSGSTSPDKRHGRGHDGHELNVRSQRQARHIHHGVGGMLHVHSRLYRDFAVGLDNAILHFFCQRSCGVTDVDLTARNIVFAPIESQRFGEPGNGMLGRRVRCGVGPWGVRGNRSVIDDASTLGRLTLHQLECFLRAEKCASQVHVHDGLPALEREIFESHARAADPGVIEQHVETAEGLFRLFKESTNSIGIADVRRNGDHPCACSRFGHNLIQQIRSASGKDDGKATAVQRNCRASTNSRSTARNYRHSSHG